MQINIKNTQSNNEVKTISISCFDYNISSDEFESNKIMIFTNDLENTEKQINNYVGARVASSKNDHVLFHTFGKTVISIN